MRPTLLFFPCSAEKVKKAREEEDNRQTVSRLCRCVMVGEDNAARAQRCGRWGVEAEGEKLPETGVTVTEINPAVSRQGALIPLAGGVRPSSSGLPGKASAQLCLLQAKEQI